MLGKVVIVMKKDGSRVPVPCTESVILYNRLMGAVDYGDQLRGYYSCCTKSRKFYKYIYHFLLDVTITNCFILHKHFHPNPRYKSIREFRLQFARELIWDYCSRAMTGLPWWCDCPTRLFHHSSKRVGNTEEQEGALYSLLSKPQAH